MFFLPHLHTHRRARLATFTAAHALTQRCMESPNHEFPPAPAESLTAAGRAQCGLHEHAHSRRG